MIATPLLTHSVFIFPIDKTGNSFQCASMLSLPEGLFSPFCLVHSCFPLIKFHQWHLSLHAFPLPLHRCTHCTRLNNESSYVLYALFTFTVDEILSYVMNSANVDVFQRCFDSCLLCEMCTTCKCTYYIHMWMV